LRHYKAARTGFLSLCQGLEPVGNFLETLFTGGLRHPRVHVGKLVGLTRDGGLQVQLGVADGQIGGQIADGQIGGQIADRREVVQMAMSAAGLAFGGFTKFAGDSSG